MRTDVHPTRLIIQKKNTGRISAQAGNICSMKHDCTTAVYQIQRGSTQRSGCKPQPDTLTIEDDIASKIICCVAQVHIAGRC